jgi:hypothetical protein
LDVFMSLAKDPFGRLSHHGKGLWEEEVQCFPSPISLSKNGGLLLQFRVGEPGDLRLHLIDPFHERPKPLKTPSLSHPFKSSHFFFSPLFDDHARNGNKFRVKGMGNLTTEEAKF